MRKWKISRYLYFYPRPGSPPGNQLICQIDGPDCENTEVTDTGEISRAIINAGIWMRHNRPQSSKIEDWDFFVNSFMADAFAEYMSDSGRDFSTVQYRDKMLHALEKIRALHMFQSSGLSLETSKIIDALGLPPPVLMGVDPRTFGAGDPDSLPKAKE